MKCEYEGTGVWKGRCLGTKEVDLCPGYENCKIYKHNTKTNADRIRAMNDEELANFISMQFCHGYGEAQIKEWLKQPADKKL